MQTTKNPLEFYLERIGDDFFLTEKDGGNVYCPFPSYEKGTPQQKRCSSKCAWFFTFCNIPEKLGLEKPVLD